MKPYALAKTHTNKLTAAISLIISMAAPTAYALDLSASVSAGAEHSDNIAKAPDDEQSDVKSTVSASIKAEHAGEKIKVDFDYGASRSTYQQDSFDDQESVTGSGSLVYEQIEKQLIWTLENTRKNALRNKALRDVETNREDKSISSVRADLIMHPSKVDSVTFSPSYTDISYEDTVNQDSTRIGGRLNWSHALSKIDGVGLTVKYDDVKFYIRQNDYEYYLYTVNYRAALSALNYNISLGFNSTQRIDDNNNGQYIKANAVYKKSGSLFALDVLQELTDTSRGGNNEGLSDSFRASNVDDVFERKNIALGYSNELLCGACLVDINLMVEDEDYEVIPRDNEELVVKAKFLYRWSRLLSVDLGGQWQKVSFTNDLALQNDYETWIYRVGLNWQLAEKLSAIFFVAYEERGFDVAAGDYDELKGGASLRYSFD